MEGGCGGIVRRSSLAALTDLPGDARESTAVQSSCRCKIMRFRNGPDGNPAEAVPFRGQNMMISRREALGSLPLAMFLELAASAADARAHARPPRPNTVFTHDLPNLTMDDWQVTVSYDDYP